MPFPTLICPECKSHVEWGAPVWVPRIPEGRWLCYGRCLCGYRLLRAMLFILPSPGGGERRDDLG